MSTDDTALRELLERHPEPARPNVVGIAATHPRALAARPRFCPCMSADCCIEAAGGRTDALCKARLTDTLEATC